mmetsp:Transcript_72138/g.192824  ORF Transcript_72138/g.192824 Transcript_72138/m.192824 type:complete len:126 (+) Transcript_72138:1177-1554(+)
MSLRLLRNLGTSPRRIRLRGELRRDSDPSLSRREIYQPAIVKETLQSFTESLRVQFFASMFVHQLKFSVVDLVYTHTTDSGPQTSSGCNVVLIPAPTQFVRKPIRRSGGETHLYVQNAGLVIAIC